MVDADKKWGLWRTCSLGACLPPRQKADEKGLNENVPVELGDEVRLFCILYLESLEFIWTSFAVSSNQLELKSQQLAKQYDTT